MRTIYLIRHCQASGQEAEAELTALGRQQAQQLADFLLAKPIDVILSSPFVRTVQSIAPYANARSAAIHTDARLEERILCAGPLEDWLVRLEQTFQDFHLALPGGESSQAAMDRAASAVAALLQREWQTAAVVTHGNLMALLLRHFDGVSGFEAWRSLSNPDVYEIQMGQSGTSVQRIWREA
ncbi:histidine phosphatase family protein [Ectobacillus ponti]|uniref:Histidine phosphatase family protein n=1 Tax=Ectobacillus ponti TaxID=2961894 RepID=A0AA41XET8_9BACI|nr:histidine phosphatase family protein [Ectobacillus ponti]MCP8970786.1 histidine phosphatase family protein [Ectobacillus ponti]